MTVSDCSPSLSIPYACGSCQYVQMYCDSPASQIIHAQNAAYDISSQIVEDQDLPDRLSI